MNHLAIKERLDGFAPRKSLHLIGSKPPAICGNGVRLCFTLLERTLYGTGERSFTNSERLNQPLPLLLRSLGWRAHEQGVHILDEHVECLDRVCVPQLGLRETATALPPSMIVFGVRTFMGRHKRLQQRQPFVDLSEVSPGHRPCPASEDRPTDTRNQGTP